MSVRYSIQIRAVNVLANVERVYSNWPEFKSDQGK